MAAESWLLHTAHCVACSACTNCAARKGVCFEQVTTTVLVNLAI